MISVYFITSDSKKLVYQKRFHNRVNLSRSETEELAKLTETLTTNRSAVLSNLTALIERGKVNLQLTHGVQM